MARPQATAYQLLGPDHKDMRVTSLLKSMTFEVRQTRFISLPETYCISCATLGQPLNSIKLNIPICKIGYRGFPRGPVVKTLPSNAGG